MKSIFIVYHDLSNEARSREFYNILKLLGEVRVVSYCTYENDSDVFGNKDNKKGLLKFLKNAKKHIRLYNPELVLLHDDYPMILIPFIKKKLPNTILVHDSSELRLVNEKADSKTIKGHIAKFFRLIEKKYIKSIDINIAANYERAQIMKEYYSLKEIPMVFDNIHRIDDSYNKVECDDKFLKYFTHNKFNVIYAGGIAEKRQSFKIIEEIGNLGPDYQLIIVGQLENDGIKKFNKLIKEKNICNVLYLGFVSRGELKYLLEKCDVNISTFALDTVNNINCASGKVFEGLFLNKPLLAGLNPPLKRLCDNYGIGISTNNFAYGLVQIKENYGFYVNNVKKYISKLNYDERVVIFKNKLKTKISEKRI